MTAKTRIFLAHASEDKGLVRNLYLKLVNRGFKPWLDEINLLPGQNWQIEIPKAIRESDIFIACLSRLSVRKQGYVQREFRSALNTYAEKPPGSIYLIPLKLDDCEIPDFQLPQLGISMRDIQWLDYWRSDGFERLVSAIEAATGHTSAQRTFGPSGANTHPKVEVVGGPEGNAMTIDLFGMVLSSAVSWGIDRLLDVTLSCDNCDHRFSGRIVNCQANALGCRNCSREIIQFTNACDYTVARDGKIGHVGARLLGGYMVGKDPLEKGWFSSGKDYPDWLFFNSAIRARDMQGRQFVVEGEIADYNTGDVYSRNQAIYTPDNNDARWYDKYGRIPVCWKYIPEQYRDKRIFAIDLKIKSKYGDVLCKDRIVTSLWK